MLKMFFFPFVYFWIFLNRKSCVLEYVDLHLGLQFHSVINLSVFMPIQHNVVFYYCGSAVQLKIMGGDVSRNCFIVQESLVGLLFICLFSVCVVEYCSFKFYKELCWNFIRDCIDSVDGFW